MKRFFTVFVLGMGLWTGVAFAMDDVTVIPTRKDLDLSKGRKKDNSTVEEKTIIYKVDVVSHSFKELQNVTVKYNIFYTEAHFGSTAKPDIKTASGKFEIPTLINNKSLEFETEPIQLGKAALDGGWYFTNGASGEAKDKVLGLWFKVFDIAGKQIGEYVNPSTLSKKQKWKD